MSPSKQRKIRLAIVASMTFHKHRPKVHLDHRRPFNDLVPSWTQDPPIPPIPPRPGSQAASAITLAAIFFGTDQTRALSSVLQGEKRSN